MHKKIWLLVMFSWIAAGMPPAGLARPLEIQDELRRRTPTAYRFSPDGSLVAVTVRQLEGFETQWTEVGREFGDDGVRRSSGQRVVVVETASERVLYESDPTVSGFDPMWSLDGQALFFCARGAERSQVWRWERKTGVVTQGLDALGEGLFSVRGMSFQPAAGDAQIVAKINRSPKGNARIAALRSRKTGDGAPATKAGASEAWRPLVFTANMEPAGSAEAAKKNPPPLASMRFDLGIWDLATGASELIDEGGGVYYSNVSPDGKSVAYFRYASYAEMPKTVYFFDLFVYDFATKQRRELARRVQIQPMEMAVSWSPDSTKLTYYSHATTGAETVTSRTLWRVDLKTNDALCLIDGEKDGRLTGSALVWDRAGERIFTMAKEGPIAVTTSAAAVVIKLKVPADYPVSGILSGTEVSSELWLSATRKADGRAVVANLDLATGSVAERWVLPENGGGPVISPDGKTLLLVQQAVDLAPGLWAMRAGDQAPKPFAGFTTPLDGVELGKSKLIDFYTNDGAKLKAALLLPPNYDGKTPLPMVVWVYPGRQSRGVNVYGLGGTGPMNAQLLASRGYAVLKPDSVMNDGWPVESLARSIMPAITTAINLGIADPARIGLWGHSQGGMSTVALLTRSTIFKAAVTSNGYYNLLSFYGSLDPQGRDYAAYIMEEYNNIFTTPWKNQRVYLENSPVLNLDRIKTPLLMTVGLGDSSVGAGQAEEVFVGLKRLGTKVNLIEYPNATHVPYDWETAQQIDYAERMLQWYDEHLKGNKP